MHRVVFIPGDGAGPELIEAAHRGLETTGVELAVTQELEAEVAK